MQQVFVARHPTEAHLVRGALEAAGISAVVRGESLFSTRGEAPVTPDTLPSVWVTEDAEAPRAIAIIEGLRAPGAAGDGWICPACGERVELQFTECWSCGASRVTDTPPDELT